MRSKFSKTCLLLVGLALSACSTVSREEFDKLSADLQNTKQTADQALDNSSQARDLAKDAQARAARSEEAVNRGFKRSMYK